MKTLRLVVMVAVLLACGAGGAQAWTGTETGLDPKYQAILSGFGPIPPIVSCDSRGYGTDYQGRTIFFGQIGLSSRINTAKNIMTVGTIQVWYDEGATKSTGVDPAYPLLRHLNQVYTLKDRLNQDMEGMSSQIMKVQVPGLCPQGICSWSNQFVSARDPDACTAGGACAVQFPRVAGGRMNMYAFPDGYVDGTRATVNYYIDQSTTSGHPLDILYLDQTLTTYPMTGCSSTLPCCAETPYGGQKNGKPYFDITWTFRNLTRTYDNMKFWYGVDTFTSGVDFGYGYVCDVSKIVGATGGTEFFQGMIALHPSDRQVEDGWGKVFDFVARDSYDNDVMPVYDFANPLNPSPANQQATAPLRSMIDNGMAHRWDDVSVGQENRYINARWTFEDPIRHSSYGTARALMAVNGDDPDDSIIYDVNFNPRDWRGRMMAFHLPRKCKTDAECTNAGETCLEQPCTSPTGCMTGGDDRPRYCALLTCTDDSDCGTRACLFGFCVDRVWETTEKLVATGNGNRNIFTFQGQSRITLAPGAVDSDTLVDMLGWGGDPQEAQRIMSWLFGTANATSSGGTVVATDNASHELNLLNTPLLRDRRGPDGKEWVLGDITHAAPVFVGHSPRNPGYLFNQEAVPNGIPYSEYINSADYTEGPRVVIVAANDGMIHAFDADTGEEKWAFLPREMLPLLKGLAQPYYEQLRTPYYTAKLLVQDVHHSNVDTGIAIGWKTVLVVAIGVPHGQNGMMVYVLDITPKANAAQSNLLNPTIIFYKYFAGAGRMPVAQPIILRKLTNSYGNIVDRTFVVVGSGFSTDSIGRSQPASVLLLDIFNTPLNYQANQGTRIGYTDGWDYRDVQVTGMVPVDENLDGFDDKFYVTLSDGAVESFYATVGLDTNPASPSYGEMIPMALENFVFRTAEAREFTVANTRCSGGDCAGQTYTYRRFPEPISSAPAVAYTGNGKIMLGGSTNTANDQRNIVMFGTGKFNSFYDSFDKFVVNPQDNPGSWQYYYQNIYGIVDRSHVDDDGNIHAGGVVAQADLVNNEIITWDDPGNPLPGEYRTIRLGSGCASGDCRGWKVPLVSVDGGGVFYEGNRGERAVTDPVFMGEYLFLNTFTPNGQGTCDIRDVANSGGGYMMTLHFATGGSPDQPILDSDFNGVVNKDDQFGNLYTAGLRFAGGILSEPTLDPIGGAVYMKQGTDILPIKVTIKPLMGFKGTRSIIHRIKEFQ